MKNLFLLSLVGAFSLLSVLDAEACHRRRCGGHHRRGCGNGCYVNNGCQTYNNGCGVYGGGYQNGGYQNGGAYQNGAVVDPNAPGAAVDANAPPAEPAPAAPGR